MLFTVIKKNQYQDSVSLMVLSTQLSRLDGIRKVSVMMGTPANIDVLKSSGLYTSELQMASPNDICIVVDSNSEGSVKPVVDQVDAFLSNQALKTGAPGSQAVYSLAKALTVLPEANLALFSIPGAYVFEEAKKALEKGLHLFIFSDNVPVEQEVALKQMAHERGLLVMGPDCGTAVLSGVPLAFANVVRPGPVGIVGASGTGIQEVTSQIDRLGGGISHAIGTGGRDLKSHVGAITMLDAVTALAADPKTRVITIISKPPAPDVREKVVAALKRVPKPVVAIFLGEKTAAAQEDNLHYAWTLDEAARLSVELAEEQDETSWVARMRRSPGQRAIKGLYSGGTLAYEAAMLLEDELKLHSDGEHAEGYMLCQDGHEIIDLGDDLYTRGRPHPMIDPSLRAGMLVEKALLPETAVILLDVVLGYGSHEDMAREMAAAVHEARQAVQAQGREVRFIASVCGTAGDPQGLDAQVRQLEAAGVAVCESNRAAVKQALDVVRRLNWPAGSPQAAGSLRTGSGEVPAPIAALIERKPSVVNIGLRGFSETIRQNDGEVVQLDWRPVAGGNAKLASILAKLK